MNSTVRRWLPWVAAAVISVVGWQVVKLHLHHDWARAQHVKDLEKELDVRLTVITQLATRKATGDKTAKASGLKADSTVNNYDSLVIALAPPIQILGAADAAIKACTQARLDCAYQVAIRDTLLGQKDLVIANVTAQLKIQQRSHKFLGFIPKPPKWLAATVGCVVGGLLVPKDPVKGCGVGGTTATVVTPTD